MGQAFAHGFAQGTLSLMQGGTFEQAFVAGALGSLGPSAWGIGMKSVGLDNFAHSATGMIDFGALSGGVGSALSDFTYLLNSHFSLQILYSHVLSDPCLLILIFPDELFGESETMHRAFHIFPSSDKNKCVSLWFIKVADLFLFTK